MQKSLRYQPKEIKFRAGDWKSHRRQMNDNYLQLMECSKKAKSLGSLVGRVVRHNYADGYAYYQVIKENKATVQIQVCTGIGDDWSIPAWGDKSTVNKAMIQDMLKHQDTLDEMFGYHSELHVP